MSHALVDMLKALADPLRLRIVALLGREELAVGELAEVLDMGQSRISHHLKVLPDAGIVRVRHEGTWSFCSLAAPAGGHAGSRLVETMESWGDDLAPPPEDLDRLTRVLEARRQRSRNFFDAAAGRGEILEPRLEGSGLRHQALSMLVPSDLVLADIGCGSGFMTQALATRAAKVILVDTDHCDPWHHDPDWVWRNLFRGNQFILMDAYMDFRIGSPDRPNPEWDRTRQAMGHARSLAERIDLARLAPNTRLASTGFCLATPAKRGGGFRCAVYVSKGGEVAVALTAVKGSLAVEWIDAMSGESRSATSASGGGRRRFVAPFAGPAILWLAQAESGAHKSLPGLDGNSERFAFERKDR